MKTREVSINLPFGIGGLKLAPNDAERRAAWILYVELSTRALTRPFDQDNARVRTLLDSLYKVFSLTRKVLHDAGPEIADGPASLGPIAIDILNKGVAPFLTCWHNRLQKHEEIKPEEITNFDHERSWEYFQEVLVELEKLQEEMRQYVVVLGKIAGVE